MGRVPLYAPGMQVRATQFPSAAMWALFMLVPLSVFAGPPLAGTPPWLGVVISDGVHGVLISEVIPDAPADEAGLIPGDEIMTVAGVRVATTVQLQAAVTGHRVGDTVVLSVRRSGGMVQRPVTLGPRLDPGEIFSRRLQGKPAPPFVAPVVFGDESGRSLDLQGRVVVIEFFSMGCSECDRMHRRLSRLVDERGRDGLVVLAVSREPQNELARWLARVKPSFTVLHDMYGELFHGFRVDQVPAVVVVNRGGDVCYAGLGSDESLDNAVFAAERALQSGRVRRLR